MSAGFTIDELGIACCATSKLRGLLGKSESAAARPIALMRCGDIHTFGMAVPIDVAFVSEDGRVLRSERALSPGKRIRCRNAAYVLERICREGDAWLEEGDELVWSVSVKPKAMPGAQENTREEKTGFEVV